MKTLYCDIDGMLTAEPLHMDGSVIAKRVEKIKTLIEQGVEVIIWTGNSAEYARRFCDKHEITPLACLRKPDVIVDDNPTIRPRHSLRILSPKEFFK